MTKECNVISNNDAVMVVNFDGKQIQFPSIRKRDVKTVFVKFEDNSYSIVDKMECEQKNNDDNSRLKKRSNFKKTTEMKQENTEISDSIEEKV